jgi:hypothetical protein
MQDLNVPCDDFPEVIVSTTYDIGSTQTWPYEIVVLMGAGRMGEIHRAMDTRLDRDSPEISSAT